MPIKPMKTLTVRELTAILSNKSPDAEIRIWLPGSRIAIGPSAVSSPDPRYVLIEGNIEPGSALDDA